MVPAIIIATNSTSPPTSCCIFSRPILPSSTRRKICGTRFGRKSSRTTPSDPWRRSTQSLRTLHSTSNAIRTSLNPSLRSPTLQGQSDMETVSVVVARTEDPDREPSKVRRVADQEHRADASGRRQRREYVIDLEVTVGRQQNASRGRNPFGKGCGGFTDQGG